LTLDACSYRCTVSERQVRAVSPFHYLSDSSLTCIYATCLIAGAEDVGLLVKLFKQFFEDFEKVDKTVILDD
jgi:hypothetical protein